MHYGIRGLYKRAFTNDSCGGVLEHLDVNTYHIRACGIAAKNELVESCRLNVC